MEKKKKKGTRRSPLEGSVYYHDINTCNSIKKKKKKIVSCTYKNKVLLSRIYIYDYYRCHGVSGLHVYHFSMFF